MNRLNKITNPSKAAPAPAPKVAPAPAYALKSELPDFSQYALVSHLHDDYAFKSDLSNLSNKLGDYAQKSDVESIYNKLSEYASKIDLTGISNKFDEYASKSDLTGLSNKYQIIGDYASKGDLTGYALKSDLSESNNVDYSRKVDFVLGSNTNPERGPVGNGRALVRDNNSVLSINHGNDFIGGVNVGAKGGFRVNGDLAAANGYFKADNNSMQVGTNQQNSWILHAPNDSRNTLFIAPGKNGKNWDWNKQTTINKNGDVNVGGKFCVQGVCIDGKTLASFSKI